MKNILFPTDFSSSADNALSYAIEFARKMNSKLTLFNAFTFPVYATEVAVETNMTEQSRMDSENALKQLENRIHSIAPDIETAFSTSWGFAADEIITMAKEMNADLIIMGTEGAGGIKRLLFGSNTAEVVSRSTCPVLAVPTGCTYKDFRRIAFATGCHDSEIPYIGKALDFAKHFNAGFSLLHISDKAFSSTLEHRHIEDFRDKTRKEFSLPGMEISILDIPDIAQGLTDILYKDNIDMIVIAHKKRNILSQLLHPSISKKITYHSASPLLVLPVS